MFFWRRDKSLSAEEHELWCAVCAAHRESAFRRNLSSDAVASSALGSGELTKAVAGALLTLGGLHGPVEDAMKFFASDDPASYVKEFLDRGWRIPGFGNSFHKEEPDPNWKEVHSILESKFPEWNRILGEVTMTLHGYGKKLFANPAAFTAITALILGCPIYCGSYLFIRARLDAWAEIFDANIARLK